MTAENLEKIVAKAVEDAEFRHLLFSNPDQAIEGYALTEQEILILKSMAREKFDAGASELEKRVSRNRLI